MGIIHHQKDASLTTLAIWEITESLDKLVETTRLNKEETIRFKKFKHKKRKVEWLATRQLLQSLPAYNNCEILYNKEGKPSLSNGYQISISHTKGFVALLLHPSLPVGIDIQVIKPNIGKATQLFMNKNEMTQFKQTTTKEDLDKLHIYWCAKEALYKYKSNTAYLIDVDLTISPFDLHKKGKLKGHICNIENDINLIYFLNSNYYCVYTISPSA